MQGVTKWNRYIRSYLIQSFLKPTNVWFSDHVRQCTLNMLIVNTFCNVPLKSFPERKATYATTHFLICHFVCNFSLLSIVETRSFYCLSKKILLRHLDKNSCEHVNRTKIFERIFFVRLHMFMIQFIKIKLSERILNWTGYLTGFETSDFSSAHAIQHGLPPQRV